MALTALIHLPPSKLYKAKGAAFIQQADHNATIIKLDTTPEKRRSQVAILRLAMESSGAPLKVYHHLVFTRSSPKVVGLALDTTPTKGNQGFWLHTPALLRAYLAFLDHTRHPINQNDIAHLLWVLREKDAKAVWNWPGLALNGSTPKPAVASSLTPVFDGAKIVMFGDTRIW